MTTITIRDSEFGLRDIIVNGRFIDCAKRIETIKKISAGKFEGTANGEPFVIVGGKASGGAANEWFVKWAPGYGDTYFPARGAAHAIRLIQDC